MNQKAKLINRIDYAGVVLNYKDKFLLQLRDNKKNIPHPNKWGTFGGGIRKGEKPIHAIIRELKEELGLKLTLSELKFIYQFVIKKQIKVLYS